MSETILVTESIVKTTWQDLLRSYKELTGQRLGQTNFFQTFWLNEEITKEFLLKLIGDTSTLTSNGKKSSYSKIMNASSGKTRAFRAAAVFLESYKDPDSDEMYSYEKCPLLNSLKRIWQTAIDLSNIRVESQNSAEVFLRQEIESCKDEEKYYIKRRFLGLLETAQFARLYACLSIVASTAGYWDETALDTETGIRLQQIVLPPFLDSGLNEARKLVQPESELDILEIENLLAGARAAEETAPLIAGDAYFILSRAYSRNGDNAKAKEAFRAALALKNMDALRIFNNNLAAEKLDKIKQTEERLNSGSSLRSSEINTASANCWELLSLRPYVNKEHQGYAWYVLYLLAKSSCSTGTVDEKEAYLYRARECGYQRAIEDLSDVYSSRDITPSISQSQDTDHGLCYVNCSNILAEMLFSSKPEKWVWYSYLGKSFSTFFEDIKDGGDCPPLRIFFMDDDFAKNLHDTMDFFQSAMRNREYIRAVKVELFLRSSDSNVCSMVDTVMSHFGDTDIRAYIINDNHWPAQHLLSEHPLFYPIRELPLSDNIESDEQKPVLHFVILGCSEVTEWLIREAFWMMEFRDNPIMPRITVLDDHAEESTNRLKARIPGLAIELKIEGLVRAKISGINIDLDTYSLDSCIAEFAEAPNHYCYYAVATAKGDMYNLSLAKRVREMLIRSSLHTHNDVRLKDSAPVAFLCKDPYIAWSSRGMVVEKEQLGRQWFNSWRMIPFGDVSQKYTWDRIDGGNYGKLALNIHYQYSGVLMDTPEKKAKACSAYFSRQYNIDSSYSEAISMPYRLFQFRHRGDPLLPKYWDITDSTPYSTAFGFSRLTVMLQKLENDLLLSASQKEGEYKAVAEWEHNRWMKWMLSRSWLPATDGDAVFAYKHNNPRQQLFVARLHPCIRPYDDLKELSEVLKEECNIDTDFYSYDLDNVRETAQLLEIEQQTEKENIQDGENR